MTPLQTVFLSAAALFSGVMLGFFLRDHLAEALEALFDWDRRDV